MVNLNKFVTSKTLKFYSDASGCKTLGMGAFFQHRWLFAQWELQYIETFKPSIEYLELYALTAAILTWGEHLRNQRIVIFYDNTTVVNMVKKGVSTCRNCMYLLRLMTLNNLIHNHRVFTQYIETHKNDLADSLSRLQFNRFWRLAPANTDKLPTPVSKLVWPASRIWIK